MNLGENGKISVTNVNEKTNKSENTTYSYGNVRNVILIWCRITASYNRL